MNYVFGGLAKLNFPVSIQWFETSLGKVRIMKYKHEEFCPLYSIVNGDAELDDEFCYCCGGLSSQPPIIFWRVGI